MISKEVIEALTSEEKVQLVGEIWNSLAANADTLLISGEAQDELDRRLEEHLADPDSALSSDDYWKQLRARL